MFDRSIPLALGLALSAGCAKTTEPAPAEPAKAEEAKSAPDSAPTEAPAAAAPSAPPARADDADRASKNGRVEAEIGGVPVIVQYGRPSVKGREIFGELVPYGELWRTGADEASTLTLKADAVVGGAEVKAGTYALFTVPEADAWTLVLNAEPKQWGAYKHDAKKDVARVKVTASEHETTEQLTFAAADDHLALRWADVEVQIPIRAK